MTCLIRKMLPDDLEEVYRLEKKIFNDAWSYTMLANELDGAPFKFPYILECDGQVAGYTFVWAYALEVHINNFAIVPGFRRKGLGLAFLKDILELFTTYTDAFLEVRVSNKPAIELYKKGGFTIHSTRLNYYDDGEDALIMHKEI